jgi:hypothetical protein
MSTVIVYDDLILDSMVERFVKSDVIRTGVSKRYKNIIDWVVNGLGVITLYEYNRQFQALVEFFGLVCENCNKKLLDKVGKDLWKCNEDELRGLILRELDYENEVLKCEKCGNVVRRMPYNNLILAVGMRSGKTVTASLIATWICYLALIYVNLDKKFRLIPGQKLRYSMVATARRQGEKTVWSNFMELLINAVDSEIRELFGHRKKKYKNGIYIDTEKETEWTVGLVDFLNLPSNSGSLAGGTGVGVVLEEYSRFIVSESFRSAQEVHTVLDRSLKTLRGLANSYVDDMFTLKIIIGSPYYVVNDPILEAAYGEGYTDSVLEWGIYEDFENRELVYHYPTWLFNPKLKESDFEKEKRESYDLFMRDYGAMPVKEMSRFFSRELVEQVIVNAKSGFEFVPKIKEIGQLKFLSADVKITADFVKYNYMVHVDLGESNDLLTMAFARVDEVDNIVVDGLLVIKPDKNSGIRAYIDTPVNILEKLKGFANISMITFDRWQSVSGIQRLMELGYRVGKRSVGKNEFELFRNLVFNNNVKIMVEQGSIEEQVLRNELMELRVLQSGKLSHTDLLCSIVGAALNQREVFGAKMLGMKNSVVNVGQSYGKFMPMVFRGKW